MASGGWGGGGGGGGGHEAPRPPTVGMELPNNLSLSDWQNSVPSTSRIVNPGSSGVTGNRKPKRGNTDDGSSRHPASTGFGLNVSDFGTQWNIASLPPTQHFPSGYNSLPHPNQRSRPQRSRAVISDADESNSDVDGNVMNNSAHRLRPSSRKRETSLRPVANQCSTEGQQHIPLNKKGGIDINQFSERLSQLREYSRQVSACVESLRSSGDSRAQARIQELLKFQGELSETERNLSSMISSIKGQSEPSPNYMTGTSGYLSGADTSSQHSTVSTSAAATPRNSSLTDERLEGGGNSGDQNRMQELMKRMAESQNRLRVLEQHQTLLSSLQRDAEQSLVRARTAVTNGQVENPVALEQAASDKLQNDLENIRQRLAVMQSMSSDMHTERSTSPDIVGANRRVEIEQLSLQDKLLELQQKKQQMDAMVSELMALRHTQPEPERPPPANSAAADFSSEARRTIAAAQEMLQSIDTTEKMRKMDEMKAKLRSVQEMLGIHNSVSETPAEAVPQRTGKPVRTKASNLSRDHANEYVSNEPNLFVSGSSGSQQQPTTSGRNVNIDSRNSATDVNYENNPVIREKTRELQIAKRKLAQLETVLASLQSGQSGLDVDAAERLINQIENDDGASAKRGSVSRSHHNSVSSDMSSRSGHHPLPDTTEQSIGYQIASLALPQIPSSVAALAPPPTQLWSILNEQMSLHEELVHRKQQLEELMRKDGAPVSSLNQDPHIQSPASDSSDHPLNRGSHPVPLRIVQTDNAASGGGNASADRTYAATWGSSSQDLDEGNESIEGLEIVDVEEEISSDEGENTPNNDRMADNTANAAARHAPVLPLRVTQKGRKRQRMSERHRNLKPTCSGEASKYSHPSSAGAMPPQPMNKSNVREVPDEPDAPLSSENIYSSLWEHQVGQLQQQLEASSAFSQALVREHGAIVSAVTQPSNMQSGQLPLYSNFIQQQHLLLGLTQCYQLLYLQHLEISRLQRQLHQVCAYPQPSFSGPSPPTAPSAVSPSPGEAPDFQINLGSWLSGGGPTASQAVAPFSVVAPVTSSSGGPPPVSLVPPFSSMLSGLNASSANLGFPLAAPPVGVASPMRGRGINQMANTTETLNNQIPPGNRANNYWDNFRSYSRQNLLTANKMGNENIGSGGIPGVICTPTSVSNTRTSSGGERDWANQPTANVTVDLTVGDTNAPETSNLRSPLALQQPPRNRSKAKLNQETNVGGRNNPNVFSKNVAVASCPASDGRSTVAPPDRSTGAFSKVLGKATAWPAKDGRPGASGAATGARPLSPSPTRQLLPQLLSELQRLGPPSVQQQMLGALQDMVARGDGEGCREATRTQVTSRKGEIPASPLSSDDEQHKVPPRLFKFNRASGNGGSQFEPVRLWGGPTPPQQGHRNVDGTSDTCDTPSPMHSVRSGSLDQGINPTATDKTSMTSDSAAPTNFSAKRDNSDSATPHAKYAPPDQDTESSQHSKPTFSFPQLDYEIQTVMSEVTPFLQANANEVLNSRFRLRVANHILSSVLSSLPAVPLPPPEIGDNSGPGNQTVGSASTNFSGNDATRYFHKQLANVLEETLNQFSGRRIRDCEDTLIVELQEVLFNELAFLHLLQSVDSSGVRAVVRSLHGVHNQRMDVVNCVPSLESSTPRNPRSRDGGPGPSSASSNQMGSSRPGSSSNQMSIRPPSGDRLEATDADLVLMVKRGDEDEERNHEDTTMSCDIPDVCAGRIVGPGRDEGSSGDEESSSMRPMLREVTGCRQPNLSSHAVDEVEVIYLDGEGDPEGEGLADNQDLAEADQGSRYPDDMLGAGLQQGLHSSSSMRFPFMDDIPSALQGFSFADRTEDDLGERCEPMGAAGGSAILGAGGPQPVMLNGHASESNGSGLDEVPVKMSSSLSRGRPRGDEGSGLDQSDDTGSRQDLE